MYSHNFARVRRFAEAYRKDSRHGVPLSSRTMTFRIWSFEETSSTSTSCRFHMSQIQPAKPQASMVIISVMMSLWNPKTNLLLCTRVSRRATIEILCALIISCKCLIVLRVPAPRQFHTRILLIINSERVRRLTWPPSAWYYLEHLYDHLHGKF